MKLRETAKCTQAGWTLDAMRLAGWADAQLLAEGYAEAIVEKAAAPADDVAPVFVTASDGRKHAVTFPAPVVNPFGVTRLEQVAHVYNELSPIRNFPGGYSHMQHVLLVAVELAKRLK